MRQRVRSAWGKSAVQRREKWFKCNLAGGFVKQNYLAQGLRARVGVPEGPARARPLKAHFGRGPTGMVGRPQVLPGPARVKWSGGQSLAHEFFYCAIQSPNRPPPRSSVPPRARERRPSLGAVTARVAGSYHGRSREGHAAAKGGGPVRKQAPVRGAAPRQA